MEGKINAKEGGEKSLDVADLELGLWFEKLGISHKFATRRKSSVVEDGDDEEVEPLSAVEERMREGLRFGANMPMLSRQGFIDLAKREYLKDPENGWVGLKRVRKEYGIWNELGEIPRSVLPGVEVGDVEEKPPLAPRSNSGDLMKVNGGEKKIEALLNWDEWQHSPPQSASESPVEVTDAVQKVNMLLQDEEVMRAEGDRGREDSIKSDIEKLEESSTEVNEVFSPAEAEKKVDVLIQPSIEELDEVSIPNEAGKEDGSLDENAGDKVKLGNSNRVHDLKEVS